MTSEANFIAALDSDRSREIVKALDVHKFEIGINRELTPAEIVEAARPPESLLHGFFDWNDKSAAEKQRLDTARRLIASVRLLTFERGIMTFRAYVSIREAPADERRYERITRVIGDRELKRARLIDFQRRVAGVLSEFADIESGLLDQVRQVRDSVTAQLRLDLN